MRVLHGGASVVLAETLGSLAANAANHDATRRWVGQEINANHLRPVREGATVTGVARPVHIGRSSQVWSIEIRNERGQLTCVSRLTMASIAAPAD
jgi:1,4-dihydroxy-2-naphthoyl-CoA hydrolase